MREFLECRGSLFVAHALRSDCLDNGNLFWKARRRFGLTSRCQGEGARSNEQAFSHLGYANGNRDGHKHELHTSFGLQGVVHQKLKAKTRQSDSVDNQSCCVTFKYR